MKSFIFANKLNFFDVLIIFFTLSIVEAAKTSGYSTIASLAIGAIICFLGAAISVYFERSLKESE